MRKLLAVVFLCAATVAPAAARDVNIAGDYLEARTADVYVGACFANSEVGLAGKEALMAWHVREGGWEGTLLRGLSVVAVVKANATLGDPHASPYPAEAVVLVDEKATSAQREALISFARSMAGDLLQNVIKVEATNIDVQMGRMHGSATLKAGDVAELRTRHIHEGDHLCGNEEAYYPPLTEVSDAVPVYTLVHDFRGTGLNSTWSLPGTRGAYIGTFAR